MNNASLNILVLLVSPLAGCSPGGDPPAGMDSGPDSVSFVDANPKICAHPDSDYDGDGLSNGQEGCLAGRDSDGDKVPDWQDFDSDGDKVTDSIEKGDRTAVGTCTGTAGQWPCDSDGDKTPDYLDTDSDDDGLMDGDEDLTPDGVLGCCLAKCGKPDPPWQRANCKLNPDGCGQGQACLAGSCLPGAAFQCAWGETSPVKKDTFADGTLDSQRGTQVCRDATETSPVGIGALQFHKIYQTSWHVAVAPLARFRSITIAAPDAKMAAARIDLATPTTTVAGFVVSRHPVKSIMDELSAIITAIQAADIGAVSLTAAGSLGKSHDRFDMVEGTVLEIDVKAGAYAGAVRDAVVAAILGKPIADLSERSPPRGSISTSLLLRLTTVRSFAFKRHPRGGMALDANGYPVDDGDTSRHQIMVIGAVVDRARYQAPATGAGIMVDDLSNGTALIGSGWTLIYEYPYSNWCAGELVKVRLATASPVKLDYVPISSTLTASLDSVVLERSRIKGFDYRPADNTLIFVNITPKPGSKLLIGYKRWRR